MASKKLIEAYEKVFDTQGKIKPCGRDVCISLIEECEKVEHQTYFGNHITGIMDIDAIKQLVKREK